MLQKIDRFGPEAITGRRQFYYGELRRLVYAENVIKAYQHRQGSANWAEWAQSNPILAAILSEAEKLCQS